MEFEVTATYLINRYYDQFQREYNNIFSDWYKDNGFEDLDEEMGTGPEDPEECLLLEFDDDFPFTSEPDNREAAICKLLWKIYENPDCDFRSETNDYKPLQVLKDHFQVKSILKGCSSKHEKQLNTVYDGEMKHDGNLNHLLAVSEKLQVLFDLFMIRNSNTLHSDIYVVLFIDFILRFLSELPM